MIDAVKVSLLYNDRAGGGASLDRIRGALTLHGHDLARVITNQTDLPRLLDPPVDVVVSAGGDGTAAAAARTVAGHSTPLAILPLGTANNIARSVGHLGSIEHLIGRLSCARRRPLDLGTARGPWGARTFVESVGGGLIATGIETIRAQRVISSTELPAAARLSRALCGYHEVLAGLEPRPCSLVVDGTTLDAEVLLIEVLNTPSIGPNIRLSPDADPSDGSFSVVVAGEGDRQTLREYLMRRIMRSDCHLTLSTVRARRVEFHGLRTLHVDDEVFVVPPDTPISIHIEPAALELLDPEPTIRWPSQPEAGPPAS